MENKENSLKEKTFNFLQRRWMDVAAFLALVVFSIYTGINFWFFLGIAAFLTLLNIMSGKKGSYKTAANVMRLIFFLIFAAIIFTKFFPRANLVKIRAWTAVDQTIADLAPSTAKTKAKDFFNLEKEKASEVFLLHYQKLLSEGKVKEAQDTLLKFEEFWSFNREPKKPEVVYRDKIVLPKPVAVEKPAVIEVEPIKPKKPVLRDSSFYRGTYYIHVNGETPFRINIKSSKSCYRYSIASQSGEYDIVFDDNKVEHDVPGKKWTLPYYEKPRFILRSSKPAVAKLIVN